MYKSELADLQQGGIKEMKTALPDIKLINNVLKMPTMHRPPNCRLKKAEICMNLGEIPLHLNLKRHLGQKCGSVEF